MAISGLTADARVIYNFMKRETNNHIHQFGIPIPSKSLMDKVARKFQSKTYTTGTRPYGVGLLITYFDGDEPHLFEITPAGDLFEYFVHEPNLRLTPLVKEPNLPELTSRTTWDSLMM